MFVTLSWEDGLGNRRRYPELWIGPGHLDREESNHLVVDEVSLVGVHVIQGHRTEYESAGLEGRYAAMAIVHGAMIAVLLDQEADVRSQTRFPREVFCEDVLKSILPALRRYRRFSAKTSWNTNHRSVHQDSGRRSRTEDRACPCSGSSYFSG